MEPTKLNRKRGLVGVVQSIGRGIDLARRLIVNLLFLFLLFLLIALSGPEVAPPIEDSTALTIRPVGSIVEQLAGDPVDRAIDQLTDSEQPETLLRDVIDGLDQAATDSRIEAVHLELSQIGGTGLSKLQDIAAAVGRVRAAGKPVIASADIFTQGGYYLAAHSDEIYLNEMGMVGLHGFALYRQYHREGLDRLGVNWNVFKVGEFKSGPESYTHREMSESAKTANREWLGDLWRSYVEDIARARNLSAETILASIEQADELLAETGGDAAQLAKDLGLVDNVGSRDAVRDRLIELVGSDDDDESYRHVDLDDYVLSMTERRGFTSGEAVGVIVARGPILGGTQPPGAIGGESTARLIRQARQDTEIKSLVLRVDSGGGSAFASEVIRDELVALRAAGKPLVVSMGTVAASGGYWISAPADEIWASPTTITGSIGIYGMFPTFEEPLQKYLGTVTKGIETNELAAALYRPDRALSPRFGGMLENMINHGYETFLAHVSSGRELSRDEVDAVGRGRVWSGEDAHAQGLVDQLGSLPEAIAAAGRLAELGESANYRYIETELDFSDRVMLSLLTQVTQRMPARTISAQTRFAARLSGWISDQLASVSDPRGLYANCDCAVEW